jgi:hypothetical protein
MQPGDINRYSNRLYWAIEKFYFDSRKLKDTFSTQRIVWPSEVSYAVVTCGSFRGVKLPGREVNSFPSGSEIKNELSHTHSHTHTHTHTHTHIHKHKHKHTHTYTCLHDLYSDNSTSFNDILSGKTGP